MAWNEFLIGKEKDFHNFINSIKSEDKVGLITHVDLDGIASTIILEAILDSKSINAEKVNFTSYYVGMFDEIMKDFKNKDINKVILTDINADSGDSVGFKIFRDNFDVFLIDHHPSDESLKDTKNVLKSKSSDCSTWILYNLSKKYFDISKFNELVCATMVSEWSFNDTENMKFLEDKFPGISKNIDESGSKKLADKIGFALVYYRNNLDKVYNLVKDKSFEEIENVYEKVEKELKKCILKYENEAEFYPEKNLYFAYFPTKFNFISILSTIISKKYFNKTYIFASDSHSKSGKIAISLRNQGGNHDVNLLVRQGIKGLENASAGGHRKASAAIINKEDLNKFIENILR